VNRRFFLVSSLFLSTKLSAKDASVKETHDTQSFTFENVHENIWVMHGLHATPSAQKLGLINNPSFIESKHGLILIDPGGSYALGEYVLKEIQKISKKPILALFNTHGHNDHFFANAVFQEAYPKMAIYAHENLKDAANELYGGKYKVNGFTFTKAQKVVFPTHTLKGGEILNIDGENLKIQHPKNAHTNNDIILSHLNSKSIFMGDLLMSGVLANFGLNSSIRGNIRFLEKLNQKEPFSYYIPGHGPSGEYKNVFVPYLRYLSIIEKEIIEAYKEEQKSNFIDFEVLEKKITLRLSWEENLNFPEGFVNRYMYQIYAEFEDRQGF